MKDNIGLYDRFLRGAVGVALLIYAWYAHSWIALGFALFTFYEAISSWCAFYAMLGKTTCPITNQERRDILGSPGYVTNSEATSKLDARKLGLSGGIVWGGAMFLMTLLALYWGYGTQWLHLMVDIYPGYTISWSGSISGLLYGFLDGFVGFFLLGWIYNKLN